MKKLFLLTVIVFSSAFAQAQVGLRVGVSAPNGIEIGADVSPTPVVKVGVNYGYLYHANSANLQVQAGRQKVYFYGTLNLLNVDQSGREAITIALQDLMIRKSNEPQYTSFKRVLTGYHMEEKNFKVTDMGLGAGIGYRYGIFFIEGGVRTTKIRTIGNQKVDVFVDSLKEHVQNNKNITVAERELALAQIEYMRGDVKKQMEDAFSRAPGKLKILPEVRIGIRIPISH